MCLRGSIGEFVDGPEYWGGRETSHEGLVVRREARPRTGRGRERSSGAMENAGDVVGVADDIEGCAGGHVDGEHSSEQVGPAETARARRARDRVAVVRGAGVGAVELGIRVKRRFGPPAPPQGRFSGGRVYFPTLLS